MSVSSGVLELAAEQTLQWSQGLDGLASPWNSNVGPRGGQTHILLSLAYLANPVGDLELKLVGYLVALEESQMVE